MHTISFARWYKATPSYNDGICDICASIATNPPKSANEKGAFLLKIAGDSKLIVRFTKHTHTMICYTTLTSNYHRDTWSLELGYTYLRHCLALLVGKQHQYILAIDQTIVTNQLRF